MIPKNIDYEAVIFALQEIDSEGIPDNRQSHNYSLVYNSKLYPPKLVISLANIKANGYLLDPEQFSGGHESNTFLRNLGFSIISGYESTLESSPSLSIVTVTIQNINNIEPKENTRLALLEEIISRFTNADVILFPAGYFSLNRYQPWGIKTTVEKTIKPLKKKNSEATLCFGIDIDDGIDQLALAVDQTGIIAMGRKFYPTKSEVGNIHVASNWLEMEQGYSRIFEKNGKRFYLAVCYDCFGIRKLKVENPDVDIVLTLAHQFHKAGEGLSGDVDFARKGFAGASAHWGCPVFGTAVFFGRGTPPMWPTGVLWKGNKLSVKSFKYSDNSLVWVHRELVNGTLETALCSQYII